MIQIDFFEKKTKEKKKSMERKASVNSQGDSAEAQFWAQEQANSGWADQGSSFVPATVVPNSGGEMFFNYYLCLLYKYSIAPPLLLIPFHSTLKDAFCL